MDDTWVLEQLNVAVLFQHRNTDRPRLKRARKISEVRGVEIIRTQGDAAITCEYWSSDK